MSYLYSYRSVLAGGIFAIILGLLASCGGGINPTMGARLIFEEQLTEQIKAQIILEDRDLLTDDDGTEDEHYGGGY